ncbi:apolipoprotein N-acyltransferase [Corynebacterium lizhenjunii]|uniref:apolipoprotein N-acyltransferase n=1 Tax=Corynebacterium lizhenjunii TaxID=2709394 RepID=UPI0013EC169B|nr:apolipoprotein N-acyltransferase [Corynebacterium lizhenjunii]
MGWVVLRALLAVMSGGLVYLSYEPHGLWWAGIGGIGMLWLALSWPQGRAPGVGGGVGIAVLHSLALYILLLPWIGELVGTLPYVALAVWLSLYAVVLGWGATWLAGVRWGWAGFGLLYLAVELLRSSVPFGGFSWVRLAWGQINGPLAGLAAWGGPALVTAAAALVGTGLAALLVQRRPAALLAVCVPLAAGAVAGGMPKPADAASIRIAAIQGNVPRLGLDFNAQRRAVLANHVDVTKQAAAAKPELVIWPENSSDVNPFRDGEAMALISSAVQAVQVPVLVGTLTVDEVGERNTMQVFNPGARRASAGEFHHKKYLQPFGETMPMREFFRKFSDMVDLAGDFKPGNGPGVVTMAGHKVGVATCYEVAFDGAFRSSIRSGAQIMTTPTNNATFGFSDQTYQQLAMSRLRAIETDRAVVVAATSGVSALVHPDGSVSQSTGIFEPGYLVEELPLRQSVTPAVKFGAWIQGLLVALGIVLTLAAGRARR